MASSEIAGVAEIEGWVQPAPRALLPRLTSGVTTFARRKPLGFVCSIVIVFCVIIGDLVPETINKITRTTGVGSPVPYLADQIEKSSGVIYPYTDQDLRNRLKGPSSSHLLGTDSIGRDTLSRLLYGARVTVIVAFGAVFISELIGSSVGIGTGYYRGWVDKFAYRVVDIFQALPGLVVLISVLGIFGTGLWQLTIVIGVLQAPIHSRVIRGQAIQIMANPYIEAGRVIGASDARLMWRYVLPNVFPLMILGMTLRLGFIVLIEASLSFLGFGLPPPFPSWGQMLSLEGRQYMASQPGLAIYPGIAIGLLVFSFNLFGDALRDVLDPRLRGSS